MATDRRTRAVFGTGTGAMSCFNTLRQLFFALYVTDVVGVDARIASLVAVVGMAWDVGVVPRIGAWSDRTRTRWGRRRPYLLLGAVPAGLGFAILWAAPPWESDAAKVAHLVLAWLVAHTLQSLVVVPYLALVPEIAPDYDERTSLTAWRMAYSLAASLAVAVGAPALLGALADAGAGRPAAHLVVGALFGLVAAASWLAIGLTVREDPHEAVAAAPTPMAALLDTWHNVPFRALAALYFCTWMAFEVVALMMPFYLTYHVCDGDLFATVAVAGAQVPTASVVLGVLLVSALPAVPLWSWLAQKLEKRTAFVAGLAVWAIAEVALTALAPGHVGAVVALAAFAGAGVAAAHVLPDAMLPDAVDYGEHLTGRRAEGSYMAAQDLLRKVAGGVALFTVLQVLGWAGYTSPPAGVTQWTQPPAAMSAILALTGPVGITLLAGAALAARSYPLTRRRQAQVQAQVRGARASRPLG